MLTDSHLTCNLGKPVSIMHIVVIYNLFDQFYNLHNHRGEVITHFFNNKGLFKIMLMGGLLNLDKFGIATYFTEIVILYLN